MAGLYIRELVLRGDMAQCLVVAPGGLVAQWQDELAEKFDLRFNILTKDVIETSQTGNPFEEQNLLIARLDHLARRDDLQAKLEVADWDLIVVDEAHRMATFEPDGDACTYTWAMAFEGHGILGRLLGPRVARFMHANAKAQQVCLRAAVEQRWREGGQPLEDG